MENKMPISVGTKLVKLSQTEFAEVAYRVMAEVFSVHHEMGRLFDEKVYRNALVARLDNVKSEVRIDVSFRDFRKPYFMDVIASSGAVFELKAVSALHAQHRSQLMNYLLLTELQHGKLVNLRPKKVEHEFVNATQPRAERIKFRIDDSRWQATDGYGAVEKLLVKELLSDWGTGLERALYEEALIHFTGGSEQVLREIDVVLDQATLAKQTVALCAPRIAVRLTTFENDTNGYRKDLIRFINRTELDAIQWINISRNQLTFETLGKETLPRVSI
ncbi:MAG: GxxExxY protein [Verrucomicrobiota bacterium]|nr:GxxExxY protein [Verrucomicrobiota bacterium]